MQEIKSFEERKKELVKLGKEKGKITYEQLANELKGLDIDADSLDDLRKRLGNIVVGINEDNDFIKIVVM